MDSHNKPAVSMVVQIVYDLLTEFRNRDGRRIFLMSPEDAVRALNLALEWAAAQCDKPDSGYDCANVQRIIKDSILSGRSFIR